MKILSLALIALATPCFAASSPARQTVETIISKARDLDVKASHADNARTIEKLVDFEQLSKDALGDRAKEIAAASRAQIKDLLRQVITKTVYPEAPKFFRDVAVDFTNEEHNGARSHITSVVNKNGRRSTVEYWLESEQGGFRVVDLAIEGERWVSNVHDQFEEIIAKYGVNGLISKLKKRVAQLESKSK
jgi:ABC-type transporter MlaC component